MEYSLESIPDGQILIQIDGAEKKLPYLEDEFRKCSTENCSCQSNELKKLDFLKIKEKTDGLEVYLTPLDGKSFDLGEIENFVVSILSYVHLIDDEEMQAEY